MMVMKMGLRSDQPIPNAEPRYRERKSIRTNDIQKNRAVGAEDHAFVSTGKIEQEIMMRVGENEPFP
jgi:hypothetical protein